MELKDTVEMMVNDDYKERFKAEYYQTKIRYDKLHKMVTKLKAGTLDFEPDCNEEILTSQLVIMKSYMNVLEVRAEIEGIEL